MLSKKETGFHVSMANEKNYLSLYYEYYTGIKASMYEFHIHIKNTTLAFIHHSFLAHQLYSGHCLHPGDTMKSKTDSTQNLHDYHQMAPGQISLNIPQGLTLSPKKISSDIVT